MKQTIYSLFLTAILGMLGMQVWAQELTTRDIDGVAYYEIGSAADLVAFADLVNGGESGANAILTADIDLTNATVTGTWAQSIARRGRGCKQQTGFRVFAPISVARRAQRVI